MNKSDAKKWAWNIVHEVLHEAWENGTIDQLVDDMTTLPGRFEGENLGSVQQKIVDSVGEHIDSIWEKL